MKLTLPTNLSTPTSPAPAAVPVSKPLALPTATAPAANAGPLPNVVPAPATPTPTATPAFTPEQLNDLRIRVLNGEQIDRDVLRRARDQLRQRNSTAVFGVKKAKDADDLAAAVNSNVLDF
jgi:uncharacterized membrane protein